MDFQLISILLGSSWASGINVYLTVAILGVGQRFEWVQLPGSMDVFSHPVIILLAIIMFMIEFFADKVPYVDSTWDAVHTFIRPVGGVLIGYYAMGESGVVLQTITAILTGTISLEAHAVKSSTRAAINTSPEPVTNSIASISEDASVILLMYLIVKHPFLATIVALVFIVGAIVLLKFFYKFFIKVFKPEPKISRPST